MRAGLSSGPNESHDLDHRFTGAYIYICIYTNIIGWAVVEELSPYINQVLSAHILYLYAHIYTAYHGQLLDIQDPDSQTI